MQTTKPTYHATIIADRKVALAQIEQVRERTLANARKAMQGVLNKLPSTTTAALLELYLPELIQVELPNGGTLVHTFPHHDCLMRVTECIEFRSLALADLKTLEHFPIHGTALRRLLRRRMQRKLV